MILMCTVTEEGSTSTCPQSIISTTFCHAASGNAWNMPIGLLYSPVSSPTVAFYCKRMHSEGLQGPPPHLAPFAFWSYSLTFQWSATSPRDLLIHLC